MPDKPQKPYPEFPLFPHACGQWVKKIRGKLHYFGAWADPDAAMSKYLNQKDDLHAGRKPRQKTDAPTLRDLCNHFRTEKQHRHESGELSERTLHDYARTCDLLLEHFGKDRLLSDITPVDLSRYRAKLAEKRGPVALGNEVGRVRVVLNYAYHSGLVSAPILLGTGFRKPSQKTIREHRQAKPPRLFTALEIRTLLDNASEPLRTMILLGINCGLGQAEISEMPQTAIDFASAWLNYPRPKTAVPRRCPLWPETLEGLRHCIENRPAPSDPADSGLVFLTRYGNRWVKMGPAGKPNDAVGFELLKLLKQLGIKRDRISFYALRHTVETVGGACKDQVAVDAIMGHARQDMATVYREGIEDERLQAVTDTIRRWLWD